jgi:hypothetical protein
MDIKQSNALKASRKLPAYGRELLALRRHGQVPAHYMIVVALDDWKLGKLFPRVVIALDADPKLTEFSMLAGLDATIAWRPTISTVERRDAAIREILRVSPSSLRAIDIDNNGETLWVKSNARGVERPEYLQ